MLKAVRLRAGKAGSYIQQPAPDLWASTSASKRPSHKELSMVLEENNLHLMH